MSLLSTIVFATGVLVGVYWWVRHRSRTAVEDPEIMRIRATLAAEAHAAYSKRRVELLAILKEPLLVDTEEALFSESLVWRRQLRANASSENEEKCKFHFNNLQQLHASWEFEHPELKALHEHIGNIREALFILEYGTPGEIQKLIADAQELGWGTDS
jgi:DNA mismatch repair ATPase MutS